MHLSNWNSRGMKKTISMTSEVFKAFLGSSKEYMAKLDDYERIPRQVPTCVSSSVPPQATIPLTGHGRVTSPTSMNQPGTIMTPPPPYSGPSPVNRPTPYSRGESLFSNMGTVEDERCVYFYSRNSHFSQHYLVKIEVDGKTFNCSEQYYMYCKALTFGDTFIAECILNSSSPSEQKQLGKRVKNFNPTVWHTISPQVVESANYAKFTQSEELKSLNTYPKVLVEASPYDRIWGVGLSLSDSRIRNELNWRGHNLLGKILMGVRQRISSEYN